MWLHIANTPNLEMRKLRHRLKADFDHSLPTEPPYYRYILLHQASIILSNEMRQLQGYKYAFHLWGGDWPLTSLVNMAQK